MCGLRRNVRGDFGRIGVAQENAPAQNNNRKNYPDVRHYVWKYALDRCVGAQSEHDNDGAWPGCYGKRERIKDLLVPGIKLGCA